MTVESISYLQGASVQNAMRLLPIIRGLEQQEKLFLLQFITAELIRNERNILIPNRAYPIWSPVGSNKAAAILSQMLQEETQTPAL